MITIDVPRYPPGRPFGYSAVNRVRLDGIEGGRPRPTAIEDKWLKAFLEAQRTRRFGHTAGDLFITQSAVSPRVRQLEDEPAVHQFMYDPGNSRPTMTDRGPLQHAEADLACSSASSSSSVIKAYYPRKQVICGIIIFQRQTVKAV